MKDSGEWEEPLYAYSPLDLRWRLFPEELLELIFKIRRDFLKDLSYPLQGDEALISSGLIDSFCLVDAALWAENTHGVKL